MITASDNFTIDIGNYCHSSKRWSVHQLYQDAGIINKPVPKDLLIILAPIRILSVEQLRSLIREHVDPAFVPV